MLQQNQSVINMYSLFDLPTGIELVGVAHPIEAGFGQHIQCCQIEISLNTIMSKNKIKQTKKKAFKSTHRKSMDSTNAELMEPLVEVEDDGDFVRFGHDVVGEM
jgi:hypothetical protein